MPGPSGSVITANSGLGGPTLLSGVCLRSRTPAPTLCTSLLAFPRCCVQTPWGSRTPPPAPSCRPRGPSAWLPVLGGNGARVLGLVTTCRSSGRVVHISAPPSRSRGSQGAACTGGSTATDGRGCWTVCPWNLFHTRRKCSWKVGRHPTLGTLYFLKVNSKSIIHAAV